MKLTKYLHACFTVEENDQMVVIDPGAFSSDFIPPADITAIIITHEHADHCDPELITQIVDKNPEAVIIAHPTVLAKFEAFATKPVQASDKLTVGSFSLEFFGGDHALIHDSIPVIANLGVMINDLLYYPGDSFALPARPVDVLALPAAAPWMRIGDAMDFLTEIRPRLAFPTHDAILSDAGKSVHDSMLAPLAKQNDIIYKRLDSSIDI